MKKLFEKYKDLVPYAVFGVLSTLVNIGAYWLLAHPLHLPIMVSTILAWIICVTFVYLTNRKWVFHSEADTKEAVVKEIISFFACRVGTEMVDIAAMFIFVDLLHLDDMAVKVVANIVVIILNYITSKFVIFMHK